MPTIIVPKKVQANASLFLQSLDSLGDTLVENVNVTLSTRLASGEIDLPTMMAVESWSSDINWRANLDGRDAASNALLSIGGRSAREWIEKQSGDLRLAELQESEMVGLQPDGSLIREIIIATPGLGTSGYYTAEALSRSEAAFPAHTNILNAHVRNSERVRTEGLSMDDLVGETIENARWEPNHPSGAGLYTRVKIFPRFVRKWGKDVIRKTQFSLYALGLFERAKKNIGGRLVDVVHKLVHTKHTSVDAVLLGGRGGKILTENDQGPINMRIVAESFTPGDTVGEGDVMGIELCVICPDSDESNTLIESGDTDHSKGNNMDIEELKAENGVLLQEKSTLTTRLNEATGLIKGLSKELTGYRAKAAIETALEGVNFTSPEAARTVKELLATKVAVKEGKLDLALMTESAKTYVDGTSELVAKEAVESGVISPVGSAAESYLLPDVDADLFAQVGGTQELKTAVATESANDDDIAAFLSAEVSF